MTSSPSVSASQLEIDAIEVLEWIRVKERRMVENAVQRYAAKRSRSWRWQLTVTVEDLLPSRGWQGIVGQALGPLAEATWLEVRYGLSGEDLGRRAAEHGRWYLGLVDLVVKAQEAELAGAITSHLFVDLDDPDVDFPAALARSLEPPHPAREAVIQRIRSAIAP